MEERVAGPIGKFDESKPLLWVEPLEDSVDRRTGRCLEPGSGAESTGLRVIAISVEVTTLRLTKILISQLLIPSGFVPDQSDRATSQSRCCRSAGGLGFDMIRRLSESAAGRSGCRFRWSCGTLASRGDELSPRWARRRCGPAQRGSHPQLRFDAPAPERRPSGVPIIDKSMVSIVVQTEAARRPADHPL